MIESPERAISRFLKAEKGMVMAQSLAKVYVHIVFSTKNRVPFLADRDLGRELHRYLGGAFNGVGCQSIIVGGYIDHVHMLGVLGRSKSIAEVVGRVKSSSSGWTKMRSQALRKFGWQNGYGIFSVSQSHLDRVRKYIANQEAHHARVSFQDEVRDFLKKYQIAYDERFVWD